MKIRHALMAVIGAALMTGAAAPATLAQDNGAKANEAAPTTDGAAPVGGDWQKICEKDKYCLLRRAATGENGVRGTFTIHYGDGRLFVVPAVPAGLLLPVGLSLKLDDAEPMSVPYTTCVQQACSATAAIDEAYFAKLRKGAKLVITAKTLDNQDYVMTVDLGGITAAYKGAATMSMEAFTAKEQGAGG